MTVHNTEQYLKEAIDSILNQTFGDFEFLIFNDGSTDGSAEIVRSYTDKRIVFFDEPKSKSWVIHLNKGIEVAKGKYIARMDSDDISLPERFAKQVAFMEAHPEIGLCSARLETIGPNYLLNDWPTTHDEILHYFLLANPIAHALILLRRSVLIDNNLRYNEEFLAAQDTELWMRLVHHTKVHILPEVLYLYRTHAQQNTTTRKGIQRLNGVINKLNYIKSWGVSLTEEEDANARTFFNPSLHSLTRKQALGAHQAADKIINELAAKGFKKDLLQRLFKQHYSRLIHNFSAYSPSLIPLVIASGYSHSLSAKSKLTLLTKCLLSWKPRVA